MLCFLTENDATAESVIVSDEPEKVSDEWWAEYVKPEDQFNTELSGKLLMLADILQMSESIGDKVYVLTVHIVKSVISRHQYMLIILTSVPCTVSF